MNSVCLVGRLTKDPDVRYANSGTSIARINVAVDRRFKKEGEQSADFISCTAFGETAEFLEKYFKKGQRIGLTGRIQTGSYKDNDGKTVYTTDVIIETTEFVESKGSAGSNNGSASGTSTKTDDDGFMSIPDGVDEELPFL